MSLKRTHSDLTPRQKWLLWSVVGVAVYALVGFLIAPPILRSQAEQAIAEALGREVRIGEVLLNPFVLSLTARQFELKDADHSPFIEFDELHVDLQLSSLYHQAFALREARLVSPFVHVKVLENGELNFADILERLAADESPAEADTEPSGPPAVLIFLAKIAGGRIIFSDYSRPTDFEHEIAPLDVELRDFGTRPDDESPYSFTATTGAGEGVAWEGNLSVVPLYSKGRFALTGIQPRTGWLYFQDDVSFEVVDGAVDFEGRYEMDARDGLRAQLEEGVVRLRNFAVAERETGERAVEVPELDIEGISLRYPDQTVRVAQVRSSGGRYQMRRQADGRFRVARLMESRRQVTSSAAEPPPQSAPSAEDEAPAWDVRVEQIDIAGYRLEFEDLSTPEVVHVELDPIGLTVQGLTNAPDEPARVGVEMTFNREGRIGLSGQVGATPALADLQVAISDIDLTTFEPYWSERVDIQMQRGLFWLKGRAVAKDLDSPSKQLSFDGGLGVAKLRARNRSKGQDLVSWSAIDLEGLALRLDPTTVHLARLAIRQPTVQLAIDEEGTSNLARLVIERAQDEPVTQTDAAPAPDESGGALPLRIDLVEIEGAALQFVDRSVSPTFSSGFSELGGRLEGLSSAPDARSKLSLEGKLNGAAPMRIAGVLSPLTPDAYADIQIHFANFELSPFTPYSGRYIGRGIGRGKLFLDLDYELDGNVLAGENKIFLDQFTLGSEIDHPDAMNLPVGLAVALLKDRNGEIHIDLDVKGEVDDPDFSVAGLVAKALINVITKVALSPFSVMGGLVGSDGDDMKYVEFEPGEVKVPPSQLGKLETLTKALAERPAISLEVAGGAAPALDRPAMQSAALEQAFRQTRFDELQGKWFGEKPERVEDVVLTEEVRASLILERYEQSYGVKAAQQLVPGPDDVAGAAQTREERKAALVALARDRLEADMKVDDAMLGELARQRARQVRDILVGEGGVSPERVFMLEPRLEDIGGAAGARSSMSLAAH